MCDYESAGVALARAIARMNHSDSLIVGEGNGDVGCDACGFVRGVIPSSFKWGLRVSCMALGLPESIAKSKVDALKKSIIRRLRSPDLVPPNPDCAKNGIEHPISRRTGEHKSKNSGMDAKMQSRVRRPRFGRRMNSRKVPPLTAYVQGSAIRGPKHRKVPLRRPEMKDKFPHHQPFARASSAPRRLLRTPHRGLRPLYMQKLDKFRGFERKSYEHGGRQDELSRNSHRPHWHGTMRARSALHLTGKSNAGRHGLFK